jgi:hypothetical protein
VSVKILNILDHKGNTNQKILRFHLTPIIMAISNNTTDSGEDVGKKEPLSATVENLKKFNCYGKQYGDSSKKEKNKPTLQSSHTTPGKKPK